MFKVEKGIPVPDVGNKRKYPFHEMAVGDSFAIPAEKMNTVIASAYKFTSDNKDKGIKLFCSRQHLRVWRVE